MQKPLLNQIAVVTGASSGIGKAIAWALGAEGATLCLLGRNVDGIRIPSPETSSFTVDLNDESQILNTATQIQKQFGGVDILIHSAGVFVRESAATASPADFDRLYRVNVRAAFVLTQALLSSLRQRRGQIVFINSSAARRVPGGALTQYAATKSALKALADGLREELNPEGVRVLSLFVGRTATPLQAALHVVEGKDYRPERLLQPEDVAATVVYALCLARTAEITEIDIRPMQKP